MLLQQIKSLALQIHPDVVAVRRHLHAYPELSFEEHETAAFVKKQLDDLGIAWQEVAGTGILATVNGSLPSDRVVALRADMDALPIQELNQVDYASRHANIMHACGHDFHTSSLLGTAKIIQTLKDRFGGTVKLFSSPAKKLFLVERVT
jgi:amidohydrolase